MVNSTITSLSYIDTTTKLRKLTRPLHDWTTCDLGHSFTPKANGAKHGRAKQDWKQTNLGHDILHCLLSVFVYFISWPSKFTNFMILNFLRI